MTTRSALDSVLELVAATEATGSLAALEVRLGAGEATPLHAHEGEEALHVLEGRILVRSGRGPIPVEAGERIVVSAGEPHSIATVGGARYLAATFTEHVDAYVRFQLAASVPDGACESDDDAGLLAGLATAAGITIHAAASG